VSYSEPPPPPAYGAPPPGAAAAGNNSKALWSMILGIVGLVCCGLFAGVPAIILALSARKEIERTGQAGSGMATAGLVLGVISVIWGVISLILIATGNFYFNVGSD
jgi:hypothetical protein